MRLGLAIVGLLALGLAAALAVAAPIPPMQDFNEWLYQGWLVAGLLRGDDLPFGLKPWPVPNAAAQIVLGGLNLGLGARAAGLAYLALYLAGWGWLSCAIARAKGRFDGAAFLLAVCIGALNGPFWSGYANSQLGTALYLVHVLRDRRGGTSWRWDLAMGIALFLCHAVLLGVFALHVLLARRAVWVLVPPFALLAWYVARDTNYGEAIPAFGTGVKEFIAYKAYSAAKLGPYHNFIIGGAGDAERAPWFYWGGVGANLLFVLAAIVPLSLALLRDAWRGGRDPALLVALACLAGFAVLPSALFGVVNVGERLLVIAMLLALVLCADPLGLRRAGAAVAALAPVGLAAFFLALPPALPDSEIGHLAAHDPDTRARILFWHRPFHFRRQIEAAQRGEAVPLGFGTSILRPVAR